MSTLVATHYLSFVPLVSRIGTDARMLLLDQMDFVRDTDYQVDLTAVVQSAQLAHPIQSMFFDASQIVYGATTVQVFGSGQKIVVPPLTQGYYPLLIPSNAFVFTVSNWYNLQSAEAPAIAEMILMNVPFVASQWSTGAATLGGYGAGPLGGNPLGQ